eukprot:TCONS_00061689-protein
MESKLVRTISLLVISIFCVITSISALAINESVGQTVKDSSIRTRIPTEILITTSMMSSSSQTISDLPYSADSNTMEDSLTSSSLFTLFTTSQYHQTVSLDSSTTSTDPSPTTNTWSIQPSVYEMQVQPSSNIKTKGLHEQTVHPGYHDAIGLTTKSIATEGILSASITSQFSTLTRTTTEHSRATGDSIRNMSMSLRTTTMTSLRTKIDSGESSTVSSGVTTDSLGTKTEYFETATFSPGTTSKPPWTSTDSPKTATNSPGGTTEFSETTTSSFGSKTEYPETATFSYGTTTESSRTVTESLRTTTESPRTTTESPRTTTESPGTTTESPGAATEPPETTAEPPGTSAEPPGTTTKSLGAATENPGTTTEFPKTTTDSIKTTKELLGTKKNAPETKTYSLGTTAQSGSSVKTTESTGTSAMEIETSTTTNLPTTSSASSTIEIDNTTRPKATENSKFQSHSSTKSVVVSTTKQIISYNNSNNQNKTVTTTPTTKLNPEPENKLPTTPMDAYDFFLLQVKLFRNESQNCTVFVSNFTGNQTFFNATWSMCYEPPSEPEPPQWYEDPQIYYYGGGGIIFLIFLFAMKSLCAYCSKYSSDYLLPRWKLQRRKRGQKVREFWCLQHIVSVEELHKKPKTFKVRVDRTIP